MEDENDRRVSPCQIILESNPGFTAEKIHWTVHATTARETPAFTEHSSTMLPIFSYFLAFFSPPSLFRIPKLFKEWNLNNKNNDGVRISSLIQIGDDQMCKKWTFWPIYTNVWNKTTSHIPLNEPFLTWNMVLAYCWCTAIPKQPAIFPPTIWNKISHLFLLGNHNSSFAPCLLKGRNFTVPSPNNHLA